MATVSQEPCALHDLRTQFLQAQWTLAHMLQSIWQSEAWYACWVISHYQSTSNASEKATTEQDFGPCPTAHIQHHRSNLTKS